MYGAVESEASRDRATGRRKQGVEQQQCSGAARSGAEGGGAVGKGEENYVTGIGSLARV